MLKTASVIVIEFETGEGAGVLRGVSRPDLVRDECLFDILEATALRHAVHPALVWGDRVVTYGELVDRSGIVGSALTGHGVGGQVVALWLPRGADLLIAQAGIAWSGAAWLPFDAETPTGRIKECMGLAGVCGVVTNRAWQERLVGLSVPVWTVEDLLAHPSRTPRPPVVGSDTAYVIFTSGTTGQPKGIAVDHRAICHFLRSENSVLNVGLRDRVYQGFSLAFDMSFEEIWISYLVGATVWIAPVEVARDPDQIAQEVARNEVTVLHGVPTLLGLIDDALATVRLINVGGEPCPQGLSERLARSGRRVFNSYGPTETTVTATIAELVPGRPVTVGMPLPNVGVMVVDSQRRPVPFGVVGELAIFGRGLAMGYVGASTDSAEKFVTNPLAVTDEERRLYLTGDVGMIEPEGPVHCFGRRDNQVKIRGFRVELDEIEARLGELDGVAAAAVSIRSIANVDHLVAFTVTTPGKDFEARSLRHALATRLPSYMVPVYIENVDQLPRLPTGKVDRAALRMLPIGIDDRDDIDGLAASTEEETALFSELRRLLPDCSLSRDADFFDDLGGHSLLVAQLVSRLRGNHGYTSLSLRDVYEARRVGPIADVMARLGRTQPAAIFPERRAVPRSIRTLCGCAQALVVPVLVLVNISNWLAPFMVYHYFTGDPGDRVPLAVIYALCTFVVVEVLSLAIGIVGSRLAAGRLRPGCYPLWGWTYFRWWLSDRLADLAPVHLLSGTPLLNGYLRAQGARIGRNVVIDSVTVRAPALLTVGDGVCIGTLVYVDNVRVHDGELIVGRVTLDRDASVDSYALLGENSAMGIGARLSGLSALASGSHVPDGETWQGAPAQRVAREDGPLPPRPVVPATTRIARNVYFVYASLAVAVLFLAPVFPSFMLIDWIDVRTWDLYGSSAGPVVAFFAYFLLAIPASALLVVVTVLLASGLRRAAVLRQQPGIFPVYGAAYRHKWLTSRILETSLSVLHGLYASVFAPIWLRLMGAQIGRFTEVSTAVGIMPDLLSLGDDSFIADAAMLGDEEQRGGWMTLRTTSVGNRSFVGNGAYLADGAKVPDDVLIGVQTRAPENSDMQAGQTWFGSPALSLPAREHIGGFGDHLTSRPSSTRRASRGSIELLRIVLPLAFVTATGYLVVQTVMPIAGDEAWLRFAEMMAIAGIAFAASSFLLVLVLKWTLIGRYQPRAAPMWTPFVWVSEAVTNIYESLAVPNLLEFLRGTPLLPWALRLLGAHIGKGVYLDTTDLTEFDCVHIGDGSALNAECGPQTHLFEDRVMKIGDVEIGANVTVGTWSTVLYNTAIGDGVTLAPFTVVAKGERLPPHTRWQGAPAAPERENLDNAEPRPLPSRTVSRPY